MKKTIIIIFAFFIFPLSSFAKEVLPYSLRIPTSITSPGGMPYKYVRVCMGSSWGDYEHDHKNIFANIIYGQSYPSIIPLTTDDGVTSTGETLEARWTCLNQKTLLDNGWGIIYVVSDMRGECLSHTTGEDIWTMDECIAHGGSVDLKYDLRLPNNSGAVFNAINMYTVERLNPSVAIVSGDFENSRMGNVSNVTTATVDMTAQSIVDYMSSILLLALGSYLGFLLLLWPYIIGLIIIGVIIYFSYRGFKYI